MDALNAFSPNTAAFIESFSFGDLETKNPTAFPPSAFFNNMPVPDRATPDESSPSSLGLGDRKPTRSFSISDDSDAESPEHATAAANGGTTNNAAAAANKRKIRPGHVAEIDEEEDEEDSDSEGEGHEDKRQHGNKASGSRRKSGNKDDIKGGDKAGGKDMTKAQRRKEQNRAAQKAFRERREAKVRDLEEKVAELEAKSFGASVENENLRGILRRLQEENVALKQNAFTFTMPVNGSNNVSTNASPAAPAVPQRSTQQTPTPGSMPNGIDWTSFANFKVQPQMVKPPSPPQSVSNDSLRSIHEASPHFPHRGSSGSGAGNSPESLVSINSANGPSPASDPSVASLPNLYSPATFGTGSFGLQPQHRASTGSSSSDAIVTPSSIGSGAGSKEDFEALFRSFYPNGIDNVLATSNPPQQQTTQSPYTFLNSQPGLMSTADSSSNAMAKLFGDATSYRDPSAPATLGNGVGNSNSAAGLANNTSAWADLTDNSVSDFLASLTGAGDGADAMGSSVVDDDAFARQLESILAQSGTSSSPSAPFSLAGGAFSPTNYLNMSPSPLQSLSNSQTPRSGTESTSVSNYNSPQSDVVAPASAAHVGANGKMSGACVEAIKSAGFGTFGPPRPDAGVVKVVGADGLVMQPSEMWTKIGLHETDAGELLIDDLCDMMKAKATCKDGQKFITYDDVEHMVRVRGANDVQSTVRQNRENRNLDPSSKAAPLPSNLPCSAATADGAILPKSTHDPRQCQAKMNEVYIQANGGSL